MRLSFDQTRRLSNFSSQMIQDMLNWWQIWGSSRFVAEDDLVPFHCSPIPSCVTPLQMEASLVDVIGSACDGSREGSGIQRAPVVKMLPVSEQRPMRDQWESLLDDWSIEGVLSLIAM
ncbi:hypothetical protein TNCV_4322121 [Trichonephila clavipes]|uniref:Uncharacterized protein n=1 Tax=Trichonephila clavipes TaxID=2585209 RepID=A0A8X6VJ21_TRICX|nr:hypothetical protein TNCV_4322121 [Trichonephila clavipes]